MSEKKIFITAGSEFVNDKNSWHYICKEKLNYDIFDLTKEKISNALISRNVIYKVNELIKMNYKTEDIINNAPYIRWKYRKLSGNKNISWNFVATHQSKKWDFKFLKMI